MRQPTVRMIRQPPAYVPKPIAEAASTTTHTGIWKWPRWPVATSAIAIAAIDFWASLAPWEYEISAEVRIWPWRKARFSGPGRPRRARRYRASMNAAETANPSGGEISSQITTRPTAGHETPPRPLSAAMAAPIRPPMKACVELLGRPQYQVTRFHAMPPVRPARMIRTVGSRSSDAIVLETALPNTSTVTSAPTRLRTAATTTAVRAPIARVDTEVAMALA